MNKVYTLIILFLCLALQPNALFAQDEFDVAGATGTVVTGINDSDYFCGYCTIGGEVRGFFNNGVDTFIMPLTAINGAANIYFMGINNVGQVVGCWNNGNATGNKAFLWSYISGNIDTGLAINSSGYTNIFPTDINDYSTICGNGSNGSDRRFWQLNGSTIAFIQHHLDGSGTVCPTYSGGVQAGGPTTGSYISNGNTFGFVFNSGNLHYDTMDLVYQGQHKTVPRGINDSGAIVFEVAGGARAFVMRGSPPYFNAGDSLSLIVIPGSTAVHPYDINNKFHTCGYFVDSVGGSHGFFERTYDIKFRPKYPSGDAWAFGNTESNMWPPGEYASYALYTTDPLLHSSNWVAPTPEPHFGSFPSWPLFVETFTQDSCYIGNLVRTEKENAWMLTHLKPEWRGSCFGMSCGAIMHFQHPGKFYQRFPDFPPVTYISDYGPVHARIDPCNQGQVDQSTHEYAKMILNADRNVEGVIRSLKQHMMDDLSNYPIIAIYIWDIDGHVPRSAHAMVPYKIARNPVTLNEEIFVYDPNKPRDTTQRIILYRFPGTYERTWKYSWSTTDPTVPAVWGPGITDPTFGVITGEMLLLDPGPVFGNPLVPSGAPMIATSNNHSRSVSPEPMEFSVNDSTNFLVTSPAGDTAMFMNGRAYYNIPGALPLTPITGFAAHTNTYLLPEQGVYNALVKVYRNGSFAAHVETTEGAVIYCTLDTSVTTQNHQLAMDSFFSYTNPDADVRKIRFIATKELGNTYYTFSLSKIPLAQNETVKVQPAHGGDELQVWNTGSQTSYGLDIDVEGLTGKYLHFDSIPFIANSSHLIKFINDSSSTTGIWIIVAQGGSIIDTIFYQNQAVPILQLSKVSVHLPVTAGTDTFAVNNAGAGSMTWRLSSVPSWITITQGDSGVQQGNIIYNYTSNTGTARTGYIVVTASGAANSPDSVEVSQDGVLGIAENEIGSENIMLYPNPVGNELNLRSENNLLLGADVNVYDMNGKLLIAMKSNNASDVKLNISAISAGTYILSAKGENTLVRKIFVK